MSTEHYNYIATEKLAGSRLDKALSELSPFSRARIQALIKSGHILVNSLVQTSNDFIVRADDELTIYVPNLQKSAITATKGDLDIVFEDQYLLVVNKPAGMTTHPGAGTSDDTLVHYLLEHCKGNLSGIGGVERPGIVHRLDRFTSGLIVIAKSDDVHHHLSAQLQERMLKREYIALVWGIVKNTQGVIESQIGRSTKDRTRMAVLKHGGKFARTHYYTSHIYPTYNISMLECLLDTGRTHQIRVHLSSIGHSIVGDQIYGDNKRKLKLHPALQEFIPERQMLHAAKISFIHPISNEQLCFIAEMPDDMAYLLSKLENKDKL